MSGTVSLRSVHGPFKSHGNNASSLMRFIHVVAAQASPERKDSSTELDTPSSPPPSRELPVVLTWCCSECQFESRIDRGMFIFHWSVENPWTCLVGKISSFRSTQYQNTTESIQFKPMKLMENHGTKTTQGACCISTMRIRGAAPHGVWMTVHKMERMIGFEVVGSNHRIQAVHL